MGDGALRVGEANHRLGAGEAVIEQQRLALERDRPAASHTSVGQPIFEVGALVRRDPGEDGRGAGALLGWAFAIMSVSYDAALRSQQRHGPHCVICGEGLPFGREQRNEREIAPLAAMKQPSS